MMSLAAIRFTVRTTVPLVLMTRSKHECYYPVCYRIFESYWAL
jgi:hypothetical protein